MELQEIISRVKAVRQLYAQLEKKEYGKEWNREQLVQGFVGDVGDLVKLTMAKEGIRKIDDNLNIDQELSHELADCLWSVIIIADKYGVDLEKSFIHTMTELETKINNKLSN